MSKISLYVPASKSVQSVVWLVQKELSLAHNIQSKQTRNAIEGALGQLLKAVQSYSWLKLGVVFFASENDIEVVYPEHPIQSFIYECGREFNKEPLRIINNPKDKIGLVVIDSKEATIGWWDGADGVTEVWTDDSLVPSKHGQGGQSKVRFQRNHDIALQAWYRKVAEKASQIFNSQAGVKYILVGGPGRVKHLLVEDGKLDYRVLPKIRQIVDNEYTNGYGLRELVERFKMVEKQ